MNQIIVIKLGPEVWPIKITRIVIDVCSHVSFIDQPLVEVTHQESSISWPVIYHSYHPAKVNQRQIGYDTPETLAGVKHVHVVWSQVVERAKEKSARDNGAPPICFLEKN
jgi:hypothetical protein